MKSCQEILKEVFGYDNFRPPQEEIIQSILDKKDTLAILPTGGGKSLCFQIPALIFDGVTIVISPLISLMQDQVEQIKSKISAEYINSFQSYGEQLSVQNKVLNGNIKLLYVSPEKFITESFGEFISKVKITLLAIDEAHCISEWGHDFRPSYLKIKESLARSSSEIPIAAFTATATPEVRDDIISKLALHEPSVFIKGFLRENIFISVIKSRNRKKKITELIKSKSGIKIIYCQSRREVDELNDHLISHDIRSLPYHAGMNAEDRRLVQDFFLNNKAEVIVATNAFGMGINKEDIRMVIHQGMPGSIENYYQEIGRAGRDGLPSEAILIYDKKDRNIHEYFIRNSTPTRQLIIKFYNSIQNHFEIKIGEKNSNPISTSIGFIKKTLREEISEGQLNSILSLFEKEGLIQFKSNFQNHFAIKLIISSGEARQISKRLHVNEANLIEWILRNYGSKPQSSFVNVNAAKLSNDLMFDRLEINSALRNLEQRGMIECKMPKDEKSFYFTGERVYAEQLPINYSKLEERAVYNIRKLDLMEKFVHTEECKWKFILNYFHEELTESFKCNNCDRCKSPDRLFKFEQIDLEKEILKTIKEVRGKFGSAIITEILRGAKTKKIADYHLHEVSTYGFCSGISKEAIKEKIDMLIAQNKLSKTASLYPTLFLTEEGEKTISDSGVKELTLPTPVKPSKVDLKVNLSLYERLRDTRNLIAKKYNQPNFMICSDEILREISVQMPRTKNELFRVKGVGEKVFLKCGEAMIQEVNSFLNEIQNDGNDKAKNLPQNIRTTLNMIREGMSLVEICEKRNLSNAIISEHVQTLIDNSFDINIAQLIPIKNIELIKEAMEKSESRFLPVIKSYLPDEISFAEIRICLSYFEKLK
ncbi:MAG: RecQ family ATP-dependent DNA helicase [Ignavibacteria bacterium]|nr:RecQ family ATP-dependent DNA helicase [Ignavibacteria bacterium]